MPVVCTRTFHHTGPGRGEAFAESSFARQIAEIEVGRAPAGDHGRQPGRRARLHGRARRACAPTGCSWSRGEPGEVYNVCSGRGMRIGDVLQDLLDVSGVQHRGAPRSASGCARPTSPRSSATRTKLARRHRLGAGHPAASGRSATCSRLAATGATAAAAAGVPGPRVKVLLTGGTGFLGKNVARALRAAGHELRLLARAGSNLAGLPDRRRDRPRRRDRRGVAAARRRRLRGGRAHGRPGQDVDARPRRVRPRERGRPAQRARGAAARRARGSCTRRRSWPWGPPARSRPTSRWSTPAPASATTTSAPRPQADVVAREAAAAGRDVVILYPGVVYGPGDLTDGNIVVKMVTDHLARPLPGHRRPRRPPVVVRLRRGRRRRARGRARARPRRASATSWPART